MRNYNFLSNIQQKLNFFIPFKTDILLLFFLGLCASLFYLAAPFFSKLFIDTSFLNKDIHSFLRFVVSGGVIFCFSLFFKSWVDVVKHRTKIRTKLGLTKKFINKLYALDMAFFHAGSIGENMYRYSDLEWVSLFIVEHLPNLLIDISRVFIILGISVFLNARLTLLLVILSPLFFLHSAYMCKKLKPIYRELWSANADLLKKIQEMLANVLIIKALHLEAFQKRFFLNSLLNSIRLSTKNMKLLILNSLSSAFISKATFGAISIYGGWLIIKGKLSLGSYTAVMIYLAQLGGLLKSVSAGFEYLLQDAVCLSKFIEVISVKPKIKDETDAVTLSFIKDEVRFDRIYFEYSRGGLVLENINLVVTTGRWIGIAGPSGCGKTTLVNLLLRFYDPLKGEILLDGIELKKIKLKSLRERISVATQEPFLFDLSFRENIALGARNSTQGQIEEAAKLAQLHGFIIGLPQGYATLIGENACKLSQGYKQRVCLARAIVRNPDLLILDEATSSIDSATEEKILNALRGKRKGLSTIVISHRLSTIKDADRLFFFRPDGKIEEGAHSELLAKSRQYQEFFKNQLQQGREMDLCIPD